MRPISEFRVSILTLVMLLSISALAADGGRSVRQVEIMSHWGGLGTPQHTELTIRHEHGVFLLNGKPINPRLVQTLVAALSAPARPKPDLQNLGATLVWLKANARSAALKRAADFGDAAPNQRELFLRSFTDPAVITKVVAHLFEFTRFDDYPSVAVTVTFNDGSTISTESHSYYEFMLPWRLGPNGEITHNADISRALVAMMPDKAVNRERLGGEGFDVAVADAVMSYIESDWKLMDAENKAGSALARIRRTYAIQAAEISQSHHPEYGKEWIGNRPHETNLHTSIRKPGFPQNVVDAVVLRTEDGKVEGVDAFLRSGGKYEATALSVPWLNEYIRGHPGVPIRVSYVHDASLGEKAMSVFAADMHARGKDQVIPDVRALRSQIVLLITGDTYQESYWLLFPDKRMMLWRYSGPSGLLNWTADNFSAGRCSAYHPVRGGCVGAVVSPEGALISDRNNFDETCVSSSLHGRAINASRPDVLFPVHEGGRGGFINRNGQVIIPLCFDSVGEFSEGLAQFERNGRWGFIDGSGAVVIAPRFTWARDFSEGLARVQVGGEPLGVNSGWGFIDKRGEIVIPPLYEELRGVAESDQGFHDGLAMVQVDGKTGFIDKAGNTIIKPQFSYAHHFREGVAAVCPAGGEKWGYIDASGNWVIRPQFDWASAFSENLAPVNRAHDCGYVDRSGALALRPPAPKGETDCAVVWGAFREGLSRWKIGEKYGYIDRYGKTVIGPRFERTDQFSEGLAWVMVDGKWSYIDKTGRMVIQPRKLHHAEDFHNGLAYFVTEDGKHGYMDKSGKYVWGPVRQSTN